MVAVAPAQWLLKIYVNYLFQEALVKFVLEAIVGFSADFKSSDDRNPLTLQHIEKDSL